MEYISYAKKAVVAFAVTFLVTLFAKHGIELDETEAATMVESVIFGGFNAAAVYAVRNGSKPL